jgi:hypothetical protein
VGNTSKEVAKLTERVAHRQAEISQLRKRRLSADLWSASLVERVERLEHRLDEIVGLLRRPPETPRAQAPVAAPREDPASDPLASVDWTLGGVLQEGLLADMLQLVSSNVMSGVFSVVSEDRRVDLFFNEGELQHATGDGLTGESAFFAAMATEQGRYCFRETKDLPPEKTISKKTQFLVLEALRQMDEARAG